MNVAFLMLFLATLAFAVAQQPAFPGAEGFGRFAQGGRGGDVYHVVNLHDSGPGSLRDGIQTAEGPRTIVFRVAGTIELQSPLQGEKSHLTIAGQSAPGSGITLSNYEFELRGDHLILRYLRFRLGDRGGFFQGGQDALSIGSGSNIIVDHCSASWGIDECLSAQSATTDLLTIQWCMITEGLDDSIHPEGKHSKGGIAGALRMSYHHNLYAHNIERNPNVSWRRDLVQIDYRNNVIYNWGRRSNHGGPTARANWVGNYYKPGPATPAENLSLIFELDQNIKDTFPGFYIEGNHMDGNPTVSADNWAGVHYRFKAGPHNRVAEPFPYPKISSETTVGEAYGLVLASAGASLVRDPVDLRIIEEVRTGKAAFGRNGILDSQDDAGGWPYIRPARSVEDDDEDGMPNWWEMAHQLDRKDPADRNLDRDRDGYTNLEEYLNWLANPDGRFIERHPGRR